MNIIQTFQLGFCSCILISDLNSQFFQLRGWHCKIFTELTAQLHEIKEFVILLKLRYNTRGYDLITSRKQKKVTKFIQLSTNAFILGVVIKYYLNIKTF